MTDLILISHVRVGDPYEADVRALLNEAYPEGAPDELGLYYGKHGPPDATVLLRLAQRIVGHLSIYESRIKVGSDEVMAGLVGEVAVAVDQRGWGHVRALMGRANQHLRERSIPFSILFAFEPPVYMSSGYRSMTNEMLFLDKDRTWKTLVYRGGMVAELLGRPWPDGPVDLCGETV